MLVAIASYGTAQDHYLEQILAEYRQLEIRCRIVVLSNQHKPVNGAEVLVGLPSRNPYSLPFAHRKLFADNIDNFDLFIYTEDDTRLTRAHIASFLDVQRSLADHEVAGFVRSETAPHGQRYITSINRHFRWRPETVEARGAEIFAELSNQHSGCFVVTRAQLARAIASGRFLVEPHDETYGMLESAASDIYRQCGLRRLLCVSRIHEFIVPHLPNKYYVDMGIPIEELDLQIRALADLHRRNGWKGTLFEPETRAPGFRWSKDLYEKPDETVLKSVPTSTRNLLSIGVGSGLVEQRLSKTGVAVHALALDAVFAETLRRRGIDAVEGPLEAVKRLGPEQFDAVLVTDLLHLVPDPVDLLRHLGNVLSPHGLLIARVDNTLELWAWLRDLRLGRTRSPIPNYAKTGVHPITARTLRRWCRASALEVLEIASVFDEARPRKMGRLAAVLAQLSTTKFILKAQRVS